MNGVATGQLSPTDVADVSGRYEVTLYDSEGNTVVGSDLYIELGRSAVTGWYGSIDDVIVGTWCRCNLALVLKISTEEGDSVDTGTTFLGTAISGDGSPVIRGHWREITVAGGGGRRVRGPTQRE